MEINWKRNLGNIDRVIRVVIGLILVGLVLAQRITGGWAVVAVLLAISQFIEGTLGY